MLSVGLVELKASKYVVAHLSEDMHAIKKPQSRTRASVFAAADDPAYRRAS
jgi:hypothetical protein